MEEIVTKGKRSDSFDKFIGRHVRALRASKRLSQRALAEAIGISYQQMQKYESGANRISAGTLYKVASQLKIEISAFFSGLDILETLEKNIGLPMQSQQQDTIRIVIHLDFLSYILNLEHSETLQNIHALVEHRINTVNMNSASLS